MWSLKFVLVFSDRGLRFLLLFFSRTTTEPFEKTNFENLDQTKRKSTIKMPYMNKLSKNLDWHEARVRELTKAKAKVKAQLEKVTARLDTRLKTAIQTHAIGSTTARPADIKAYRLRLAERRAATAAAAPAEVRQQRRRGG
ncbi:hypothetical protein V8F20_004391 [Naviculisporaceae sp. PSN 640]